MNLASKPLPKSHTFPGGYKVAICEVDRPSKQLDEDEDASWFINDKTIYMWSGLTPGQKWRRLYHELGHAWLDAQRWADNQTGVN